MSAQIKDLKNKCTIMSSIFANTYFNAHEANVGLTTVFAPSIMYALPLTTITPDQLRKIQQPVINSVLSRLGYNKHMPRSVVFAARTSGGIGLIDLPTEQGTAQVKLIVTHLLSRSYIHDTIMILLESYQVHAGTLQSPFIDTSTRAYVDAPWIQSVQKFLCTINGTIIVPSLKTIVHNRINDRAIMANSNHFSKSEQERINACRLFLQVTLLSETSNDNGTHILSDAVTGATDKHGKPLLWQISRSSITWPMQQNTPRQTWNLWKKFLTTFTDSNRKLNHPLGHWTTNCHQQRKWHFTQQGNEVIRTNTTPPSVLKATTTRSRHSQTWKPVPRDVVLVNTSNSSVIPSQIQHRERVNIIL
jgi:hypothetical protein